MSVAAGDVAAPLRRAWDLARGLRIGEALLMLGFPTTAAVLAMPALDAGAAAGLAATAFCLGWMSLSVYAANSWAGFGVDSGDPKFSSSPQRAGRIGRGELLVVSLATLAIGLLSFAVLLPQHTLAAAALWLVWFAYSHPRGLKRLPFTGTLLHLAGGLLMLLIPYVVQRPLDARAWLLAGVLVVAFASGHLNHEVLDHASDAAGGLATTAVVLGPARTHLLSMTVAAVAYLTAAAGWRAGILAPWVAAPFVAAAPVHLALGIACRRAGLDRHAVLAYRRRYRFVFGLATAAAVAGHLVSLVA